MADESAYSHSQSPWFLLEQFDIPGSSSGQKMNLGAVRTVPSFSFQVVSASNNLTAILGREHLNSSGSRSFPVLLSSVHRCSLSMSRLMSKYFEADNGKPNSTVGLAYLYRNGLVSSGSCLMTGWSDVTNGVPSAELIRVQFIEVMIGTNSSQSALLQG
jgi:hypothetical protein